MENQYSNVNEVKEALRDRFRVINMETRSSMTGESTSSRIEELLNEYGSEGFAIQYILPEQGLIIMLRVVRINDVQIDGQGDDFTFQVPGAQGSA